MNTIQLKSKLHTIIDTIEDGAILNAVYTMLAKVSKKDTADFWNELSAAEKASIEEGLADIEKGATVPYERVRKEAFSRYGV